MSKNADLRKGWAAFYHPETVRRRSIRKSKAPNHGVEFGEVACVVLFPISFLQALFKE